MDAKEAGQRDRRPLKFRTNMDGSPLAGYAIERRIDAEWVKVSEHDLWNNARRALDGLQNQHGASFARMVRL